MDPQSDESNGHDSDRLSIAEGSPTSADLSPSLTVMVVDDEPAIVQVVESTLRRADFSHIVSTTDSREALNMLREKRPDVLLMDVKMPYIDGIDILIAMRHDNDLRYIPVVVMSALPEGSTEWRLWINSGADGSRRFSEAN